MTQRDDVIAYVADFYEANGVLPYRNTLPLLSIPLMGRIGAGTPAEALRCTGDVKVSPMMIFNEQDFDQIEHEAIRAVMERGGI